MAYLQIGAPKCGNFWLYQILQQVLKKAGRPTSSFIEQQPIYQLAKNWDLNFPEQSRIDVLEIDQLQSRYRISSIYSMPIEDMEMYVQNSNHVWTHSPFSPRAAEVISHFEKNIYIVRDPRDRAISASKYFTSPYMLKYFPQEETDPQRFLQKNLAKLMHEWVWHVFDYLRMSEKLNIHLSFFEGFKLQFQSELQRLLKYLQLDLSEEQMQQIEEEVSFKNLKKNNPKHLQRGETGYWRQTMTEEQGRWATAYALPLLKFLGYSPEGDKELKLHRKLPHRNYELLKQELIEAQQHLGPLPNP